MEGTPMVTGLVKKFNGVPVLLNLKLNNCNHFVIWTLLNLFCIFPSINKASIIWNHIIKCHYFQGVQ